MKKKRNGIKSKNMDYWKREYGQCNETEEMSSTSWYYVNESGIEFRDH